MSGIQPTGVPHIGNLFGAIDQWSQMQSLPDSQMIISIVDLHSVTLPQNPSTLRHSILDMAATLIACGIDYKKTVLFQQSAVLAHANLGWILGCMTSMAKLEHLPQWKEKYSQTEAQMKTVPLGLFTYPVLQAADILIYRSTHVPVGDDQIKHIELARYLAKSFNTKFGNYFPQPEPLTVEYKRIRSLRNPEVKMSKSDKNHLATIFLTDSPDVIQEKIKKAVTDFTQEITYNPVERPGVSNLIDIICACTDSSPEEVCENSLHMDTVEFKKRVADAVVERLRPVRETYRHLTNDVTYLQTVIKDGNDRAATIANATYEHVRHAIGFT